MNKRIIAIAVLFSFSIILTNLIVLGYNSNFYKYLFEKENIYKNFSSNSEVDEASNNLITYFRGQSELDQQFYSNQAISHLKDVKFLLNYTIYLSIASTILFIVFALYSIYIKKYNRITESVRISAAITFAILLLTLVGYFVNFDGLFTIFHKIFFKNELWLFDPKDNLIKLYPPEFFIAFLEQLILNILITIVFLLTAVYFLPKHDTNH